MLIVCLGEVNDRLQACVRGLDDLGEAVLHREERIDRLPDRGSTIAGGQQVDEISDGHLRGRQRQLLAMEVDADSAVGRRTASKQGVQEVGFPASATLQARFHTRREVASTCLTAAATISAGVSTSKEIW